MLISPFSSELEGDSDGEENSVLELTTITEGTEPGRIAEFTTDVKCKVFAHHIATKLFTDTSTANSVASNNIISSNLANSFVDGILAGCTTSKIMDSQELNIITQNKPNNELECKKVASLFVDQFCGDARANSTCDQTHKTRTIFGFENFKFVGPKSLARVVPQILYNAQELNAPAPQEIPCEHEAASDCDKEDKEDEILSPIVTSSADLSDRFPSTGTQETDVKIASPKPRIYSAAISPPQMCSKIDVASRVNAMLVLSDYSYTSGDQSSAGGPTSDNAHALAELDETAGRCVVICACADSTLQVLDCATGQVLRTLCGHTSRVLSVAVSQSCPRYLVSGTRDGEVKLWLLDHGPGGAHEAEESEGHSDGSGDHHHQQQQHDEDYKTSTACDDNTCTSNSHCSSSSSVMKSKPILSRPSSGPLGAADSRCSSTCTSDVYRPATTVSGAGGGGALLTIAPHKGAVWCAAVIASHTHSGFVSQHAHRRTDSNHHQQHTWKSRNASVTSDLDTFTTSEKESQDGDITPPLHCCTHRQTRPRQRMGVIITGSDRGSLVIRDIVTGSKLSNLKGHTGKLTCLLSVLETTVTDKHALAMSNNNHRIVSAGSDGTIRIWGLDTGGGTGLHLRLLEGHASEVVAIQVVHHQQLQATTTATSQSNLPSLRNANNMILVSGSLDKTCRVWDFAMGFLLFELCVAAPVLSLSVAQTQTHAAVALVSSEGGIAAWCLTSGQMIRTWQSWHHKHEPIQLIQTLVVTLPPQSASTAVMLVTCADKEDVVRLQNLHTLMATSAQPSRSICSIS